LPDVIGVFAAGVLDVIVEVPTGFVVFHVAYTVQPLPPDGMMHEYAESVRVPVGGGAHVLVFPFHVVPDVQFAVAVCVASVCWLLMRKKVRVL